MSDVSVRADYAKAITGRVIFSRAIQVAGLQAVIAGSVYVGLIVPRQIEWYEASFRADRVLFDRLLPGDFAPARVRALLDHREECFPSQWEWIWARFRNSAEQLEKHAMRDFVGCLEDAAAEAKTVRAWTPPGPDI